MQSIEVGDFVYDVAIGESGVWLFVGDDRDYYSVRFVDPASLAVGDSIPVGDPGTDVFDVTAGEGAVWVPRFGGPGRSQSTPGSLLRIDAMKQRVIDRISVGRHSLYAAAGGGAVWVANEMDGTVSVVDPKTNGVTDVITVGGAPNEIRFAEGAVWVEDRVDRRSRALLRIDPASHHVETILSDRTTLAIADGAVWFTDNEGIGRYDIATKQTSIKRLSSDAVPGAVAAGEGNLWFAKSFVDPEPTPSGSFSASESPVPFDRPGRPKIGVWKVDHETLERLSETVWLPGYGGQTGWVVGLGSLWVPASKQLLRIALSC